MHKKTALVFAGLLSLSTALAEEGAWTFHSLPDSLFEKIDEEIGCDLRATDFYSLKEASIKDQTFYLSNGYTATAMSAYGLLLVPYSAVEKYLPDSIDKGNWFYAEEYENEIPLSRLYALAPISSENLGERIAAALNGDESRAKAKAKRDSVCEIARLMAVSEPFTLADIKDNGYGEPVLHKYRRYPDLRLVCAPPASIALIESDSISGAVTSHNADFAFIRAYVDMEGTPALYNAEANVPAEFDTYAVIAGNEYEEEDAVFAAGYPNKSQRGITSAELYETVYVKDPVCRQVWNFLDSLEHTDHSERIAVMNEQLKYLRKQKSIGAKQSSEDDFTYWAANSEDFDIALRYTNAIPLIRKYSRNRQLAAENYIRLSELLQGEKMLLAAGMLEEMLPQTEAYILPQLNDYFLALELSGDLQNLSATLDYIKTHTDSIYMPDIYATIDKEYKGKRDKFFKKLSSTSFMTDEKRFVKYLDQQEAAQKDADLMLKLYRSIRQAMLKAYSNFYTAGKQISFYTELYNEGRILRNPVLGLYPDADYTLRLSIGKIEGYEPVDGIILNYSTSAAGAYDAVSPSDSLGIYPYSDDLKDIRCNFLCSVDMPGQRMGMAVYDLRGELLGMLHSANAESAIASYAYNKELQRAFAVDMQYIIWLLEKSLGNDSLLDEMEFGEPEQTISIQYENVSVNLAPLLQSADESAENAVTEGEAATVSETEATAEAAAVVEQPLQAEPATTPADSTAYREEAR